MPKLVEKVLRGFLICAGMYFIFDGLLHFSGLKLASVNSVWPQSATSYAQLLNYIYASFICLAGAIALFIQRDLKRYKGLIILTGIWAVIHGLILLFLVSNQNYQQIFQNLPSLLVWLPFYKEYLIVNAVLLFGYSGVVYFWSKT